MKTATLTLLCLTALAPQAHASSPDAWAAYDKAVLAGDMRLKAVESMNPIPARPQDSILKTIDFMIGVSKSTLRTPKRCTPFYYLFRGKKAEETCIWTDPGLSLSRKRNHEKVGSGI